MNEGRNEEDFFKNIFNYAVVIKCDITSINELKRFLADHNINVCFQKISTNFLRIKEEGQWVNDAY